MEHDLLTPPERGRLWVRLGIRALALAGAAAALVYLVLPLLGLLLPFVLALVVAWLLNPMVRALHRKLAISRRFLSLALLVLLLCLLGGAVFALGWAAVGEVRALFENFEELTDALLSLTGGLGQWLDGVGQSLPRALRFSADGLSQRLSQWLQGLDVSGWLASLAGRAPDLVGVASGVAVGAVAFVMASYFITGDYPRLRFLLTDRVSAETRVFCGKVKGIFMNAFGGYLKSQLLLSLGVFVILAAGFLVIGQPYALVLAVVLAVLDFIPIVGAGTVMAPWAVLDLITGQYPHAIRFAVIWGLIVLFRRLAEPKILGNQTGLSPILSLVGIYAGMRLAGVAGMILGPLLLLVCVNLARLGIFRPALLDVRRAVQDVRALLRQGTGGVQN